MRIAILVVGVLALLLGGLWLVQGLGLVRIEPIACVGDCETIEGFNPGWAIAGAVLAVLGALAIRHGLRRR